jgi:CMP-N,N'-diacetyllegionaminic acid synthase
MVNGGLDILCPGMVWMTKKILGIIPARGGSKSLPNKNILNLMGKPLVAWTIIASRQSRYISKTVVSSDDDEIIKISKAFLADTIQRPPHLALDETPTEPVLEHALELLTNDGEYYDYIMLLQPTSPLRNSKHIDDAIEYLLRSDANALISIYETNNKILKAFSKTENGYIHGLINNKYPFARRQDLPKIYMSNGAIYLIKTDVFLITKKLITDRTIGYIMGEEESLDIDLKSDLNKAALYLTKKVLSMNENTREK